MTQMPLDCNRLKIAIVGGGIAGISAAEYLHDFHDITLFEKNSYLGGHTNTIPVDDPENPNLNIDTGFIVFNTKNYPNFTKLLKKWNVDTQDSNMSFSYHSSQTKQMYAGTNFNGLFSKRINLFNPKHWQMLKAIVDFGKMALQDLEHKNLDGLTLGEYLKNYSFPKKMIAEYLIPMGSAIWSTHFEEMLNFPAKAYLHFFKNHGLLDLKTRPQWRTIKGGSFQYVKAFQKKFSGKIHLNFKIDTISRENDKIKIHAHNKIYEFDRLILAVHADQVLKLLKTPSPKEKHLFEKWKYTDNPTILHTDTSFLPPKKRSWASWNYHHMPKNQQSVYVTYHMNRLQNLKTSEQYCVTLNSHKQPQSNKIIRNLLYQHPLYSIERFQTQNEIQKLNGQNNTYYCGSYLGYGFHEDAVKSSVNLVKSFGVTA